MANKQQHAILVVDDDRVTLKYMQGVLSSMPCKIYFAQSGREALARAEKVRIDLAFIDIVMPNMDGFETMMRWKKIQPETKIVIMSSYNDDATVKRAIEQGAHTYLFKPINRIDVFSIVSKTLKNAGMDAVISYNLKNS